MTALTATLAFFFCLQSFGNDFKKLVIIGDSLTEGYGVSQDRAYPALLQKKVDKAGKKWRIVNSGISGSTSASALTRVNWALKQKPNLILIALGSNDGLRGLPAAEIEKNLGDAVAACKRTSTPVVLAGSLMPPNYGAAYTRDFADAFRRVADKEHILLIPNLLDKVGGKTSLNLADGIHPNEKGHEIVAETVYKALQGSL